MQRITDRIVELTNHEMKAHDRFNELLDEGYGIKAAVLRTFEQYPDVSAMFLDYLEGR